MGRELRALLDEMLICTIIVFDLLDALQKMHAPALLVAL